MLGELNTALLMAPVEAEPRTEMLETDKSRLRNVVNLTREDLEATTALRTAGATPPPEIEADSGVGAIPTESASRRGRSTLLLTAAAHVSRPHVAVLSQWEGTVTEIGETKFSAWLVDVLGSETEYVATIPLDEVAHADLPLVQEGAVFDWVVGVRREYGTQQSFSQVTFRRLPAWTESDLARLRAARGQYDVLFSDEPGTA